MRRFAANRFPLLLLACTFAASVHAQTFDLEAGYRWLQLTGNSGMYRTQINERDGLLIRSFTLTAPGFQGHPSLADRVRIDVSDFGAGPAQSIRMEAVRDGGYRLRIGYRSADAFSSLPQFANPLFAQGVIPGQHTYDRKRQTFDADLELLTGRAIAPFIGYTSVDDRGPGQTTLHLGQDEFLLQRNLHTRDRELRAGAAFHFTRVYGAITQGWRTSRGTDSMTLAPGAGNGNNSGPIIGQPVSAGTLTRTDLSDVDTPFTNFFVTGQVHPRVRLIGNYVRFAADSDASGTESASGSFVSFALSRFFTGLTESASSNAKNTTWRSGARAEVVLTPGIDFLAGYQREHRTLEGGALIDTLFLQSLTFSGFDPRDIATVLRAASAVERNEKTLTAALSARAIGPFSLRGEFRETRQDVTVSPDLSEIVVPGNQEGTFERRVHTFDLNGTYNRAGWLLTAAWRRDSANDPVFRTDYLDRNRLRARAVWSTPKKMLRAGVTAERTTQSNDRQSDYDARARQYTGEIEIAPVEALSFHASVSQFRADSSILIRHPENFTNSVSLHKEYGHALEGGFALLRGPFSIDASTARFENGGSSPFAVDRNRVRMTWDFKSKSGIAAEWNRDRYAEHDPSAGDFEANRYGLYLRWRR